MKMKGDIKKKLQEKYSVDNLFKNKTTVIKQENTQKEIQLVTVENKTFIQKIIEKIKNIFRR